MRISKEQADEIFNILKQYAGAHEGDRDQFLHHVPEGCLEFRFQGRLGFGGKFFDELRRYRVGYYPEDRTDERDNIVDAVNKRLEILFIQHHAARLDDTPAP